MKCPACNKELITIEYKNIELDYCIHCYGIWFDHGELMLLKHIFPEKDINDIIPEFLKNSNTKEQMKKCPHCHEKMDKVMMKGQPPLIDYCPNHHGIWFDKSELAEYIKSTNKENHSPLVSFLGEIF